MILFIADNHFFENYNIIVSIKGEAFMKRIEQMDNQFKNDILSVLYEKEMLNVQLIHTIESGQLGELYVSVEDNQIIAILHLAFDGNSYFTNFSYQTQDGLQDIQMQLKKLNYERILLAGTSEEVAQLTQKPLKSQDVFMACHRDNLAVKLPSYESFYRASLKDMNDIGNLFIDYFEATTDTEIAEVTAADKLIQKIENGLYLLKRDDEVIGMARFSGNSKQYINITSLYIRPSFRQHGYGSLLLKLMIQTAHPLTPVLQTSSQNHAALKLYKSLGFEKIADYTFEFID